jgi:hypothetical protein
MEIWCLEVRFLSQWLNLPPATIVLLHDFVLAFQFHYAELVDNGPFDNCISRSIWQPTGRKQLRIAEPNYPKQCMTMEVRQINCPCTFNGLFPSQPMSLQFRY